MKQKVNPNRMELFRLRRRLVLALRGHKLLKDKLEGLVRELTALLADYADLSRRFDADFPRIFARFTLAAAVAPQGAVADAVRQNVRPAPIQPDIRRVMGVPVPVFKPPELPTAFRYSLTQTPPELDLAFDELRRQAELLFRVAETERALQLLARELERTRRRTNALEHVLIPELRAARKDIEQKLGEQERSNTSRLMKVKDMLLARR